MDKTQTIAIIITLINALLIGGVLIAYLRLHQHKKHYQQLIQTLQQDFNALCTGANGISGHLSQLDRQIRRLTERQEQVEQLDADNKSYQNAINMIRKGATIEELEQNCGLMRAEAELLLTVHQSQNQQTELNSAA